MNVMIEAHEIARSRAVLTDPATYAGFDLTPDHRRMVGCIDPRDEASKDLSVIVQTPGGAIGKGFDATLALTAYDGDKTYSMKDGLGYDKDLQRATLAVAHHECRFVLGLGDVAMEVTNPSDETHDTVRRLISRYGLRDDGVDKSMARIVDAARRTQDEIAQSEPDALLETVDNLYPQHPSVVKMHGDNRAKFYIFNHHPYAGLDRTKIHRGENPLVAQAYHDSVRASMDNLSGTVGMPPEVKGLRLGALLLRSAATRTVLCKNDRTMVYLNVTPTDHGLQVEQDYL